MAETLFEELKRYVGFGPEDEQALRGLHPVAEEHLPAIADAFYARILEHEGARTALRGGESKVGHLKVTLREWMDQLLRGPWDEGYFARRCRIGRAHVRIGLPQHYMFGAMNVLRAGLAEVVERHHAGDLAARRAVRTSLDKILELELAVMLHTFREDMLAQQARAERLSTFGQLVGSIGHELRNPLGVIETSLFILKGRPLAGDERATKHLERIGEQVVLANRIISDLLDMIRDRPLRREPVRLEAVWEDACRSVEVPPGVVVAAEGLSQVPVLLGDGGQLRQVFLNLLENAVQAVGDSGAVTLSASSGGGVLELALEDSGPGVSEGVRRRLFEPLMSTKARGIGLGLPLVKRIVERHGGSIAYDPRPGRGARFVLRFPLEPAVPTGSHATLPPVG